MTLAWVRPDSLPDGQPVLTWQMLPGMYGLPVATLVAGVTAPGQRVVLGMDCPVTIEPGWVLDVGELPVWPENVEAAR